MMKADSRKCVKCSASTARDPKLILHRFPKPGSHNKQRVLGWAKFCYPDGDWNNEEFHTKLYLSHKMLCSKHFPKSAFVQDHMQRDRLHRYAIPSESPPPMPSSSSVAETENNLNDKEDFVITPTTTVIIEQHAVGGIPENGKERPHRYSVLSESRPATMPSTSIATAENNLNNKLKEFVITPTTPVIIEQHAVGGIPENGKERPHRYAIPSESPPATTPSTSVAKNENNLNNKLKEFLITPSTPVYVVQLGVGSVSENRKKRMPKFSILPEPSPPASMPSSPIAEAEHNLNDELEEWVFVAMRPILIVHGGAGDIPENRVQGKLDGVRTAVREGYKILLNRGSALDAVEAAVVSMEKDEYFNAGYGSVLNLAGEVEMEASIMSGKDLNAGAVTLIKDFLHPISIAHKVLTDSPHSLLGGRGAKEFALAKGFPTVPPKSLISENAKAALNNFLKHGEFGRTEIGVAEGGVGTVGAVAIDTNGNIAVATSTGGMSGKAVGRIGDTPQIGSGTYADDNVGGVSTTGHGESILKYCLAHSIVKLMESGVDASTATKNAVTGMTSRLNNTAGAITLSKNGDVGIYFSSNRMAWAYIDNNKLFYGIEHDQVLEDKV